MGETIADMGVTSARFNTIYKLAKALSEKDIDLDLSAEPEYEIKKLMEIRGIGIWAAQYIAMRSMEWPDAFLETDVGTKKAFPKPSSKELLVWQKHGVRGTVTQQ